ncbi:MAG: SMI1/KNR4 family protein [Chitinophagaceae bacterium]|nr:SMI1/KNR4 family protein [Chitinophagaceae bacterium]
MTDINLQRVINWLTINASRIVEFSLNKPATDEQISNLQKHFDKELPGDFINLYKTYNGMNDEENMGNFFYALPFLSIDNIIADKEFRNTQSKGIAQIPLTHFEKEIDGSNFYNPNWIALCFDGSRSYLRLDLSPSDNGTYGQIIFVDGDYNVGLLIAHSINELIFNFAEDIDKGLYSLNEEALEDEQHFLEADTQIDIINWHKIDKWKNYV